LREDRCALDLSLDLRLREMLASICPGLERITEVTNLADLVLPTRHVTPAEVRRAVRRRITELNGQIAADLDTHPDGDLVLSLPGPGATLAAEFLAEAANLDHFAGADQLADRLASAAGLAPVLPQPGTMCHLRGSTTGSKDVLHAILRARQPYQPDFQRNTITAARQGHQAASTGGRGRAAAWV
jgi:transposase